MKTLVLFIAIFFSAFALVTTSFAQLPFAPIPTETSVAIIESNYLAGLESEVQGLKVSSAFFLGEMESERAVIPLMKMFREAEDPGTKFVAAWSLLKIGDKRGVYLVKTEAERSDCKSTSCICEYLYKKYSLDVYGEVR